MIPQKNKAIKDILEKEERRSESVRNEMSRQMQSLGYGAVVWGANLFGSADYPLISAEAGRIYNVHGICRDESGNVMAVISNPSDMEVEGVMSYTPEQAERLISHSSLTDEGTPEEWEILGDCFATAVQQLSVKEHEDRPLPWW